jgi:outer membrane protein TolC
MRKYIILLLIVILSSGLYSQEEINKLSLDDVIYIAHQQSPDALIAKHRFRRSYWEYRSYRATYLPSLVLDGTLPNYNRSIQSILLPDGSEYIESNSIEFSAGGTINQRIGFTGGNVFLRSSLERRDDFINDSTSYYSVPIQIGYSQPIFKYNPWKWDRKIEPLKYEEAQRVYIEDVEQISITATQYFFNLLLSQIEREIAAKNYANYDTLYRIAKGRYNLGTMAENELLQLELNLLQAEASVDNADLEFENNLFKLKSFLRIRHDARIELLPPNYTEHFHVDAYTAVEQARLNTSSGIAFERRLLEAESDLNAAKMNGRFDAELYALFGLNKSTGNLDQVYQNPDDLQNFQLGITIPILDWGVAKGQIKMAESNQELVRTSVEQEKIDFEQNIYIKVLQFNMQEKQLVIAAKSDTVAQKRFNVTQQRYLIGKVNDVLELNQAQIENDNAKKGYYQTLKTYWTSYFELRKLTLFDFRNNERIDFDETSIL